MPDQTTEGKRLMDAFGANGRDHTKKNDFSNSGQNTPGAASQPSRKPRF
jgi:hypothetical protein